MIPFEKMSITWCELYQAYSKSINVITFSRQRTLDEKETRRRNQFLIDFQPAYVDHNEIFDLIDWITKQKINNWIIPFNTIVDFEKKLIEYIDEFRKPDIKIPFLNKRVDNKICIIVEGGFDRTIVREIVIKSKIDSKIDIISADGKYRILRNFKEYIQPYSNLYEQVLVLVDTDANTDVELTSFCNSVGELLINAKFDNVKIFGVNSEIEAWIVAGLDKKLYRNYDGFINKDIYIKQYGSPSLNNLKQLMKQYNINQAMQISPDLSAFIDFLKSLVK